MQKEPLRQLGGEDPLDLHRARSRTSEPVCVLISHPYDTALRGRLPSENRFEHGPRTPRMPFDNAAASVNGDSLAFSFSRPRYAAFRIKSGFTWVLYYWGLRVGYPYFVTRTRTLLTHWSTVCRRRRRKGRQYERKRKRSDSKREERKRRDRVILDIGCIYIPVCPLIRHGSESVKVS